MTASKEPDYICAKIGGTLVNAGTPQGMMFLSQLLLRAMYFDEDIIIGFTPTVFEPHAVIVAGGVEFWIPESAADALVGAFIACAQEASQKEFKIAGSLLTKMSELLNESIPNAIRGSKNFVPANAVVN